MRSIIWDEEKKLLIINLHLEEVFNAMLLNSDFELRPQEYTPSKNEEGIYIDKIKQSTYSSITLNFPSISEYTVCLYWGNLRENDKASYDNFVTLVNKIIENNNTVDIWCDDKRCLNDIKNIQSKNYFRDNSKFHICTEEEKEKYEREYERILDKKIQQKLMDCRRDYDDISASSPVRLKYYIDIKPMIEDINFFSNAMYKLALSMPEVDRFDPRQNKNIALVVTSLNGELIGSILAQLFGFDVVKIDHLGPRNELFINSLERYIDNKKQYYIVADVICMGREVNTAKSIINMYGAKCKGFITMVNIVPTGKKPEDVHCLVNIDKNNNYIGYKISVDL